ncbi:hypothetical protein L6E12_27095 [Actinokineospora sp. PR83]|uniref:hypothetical protein n=1 Tax=Actinokineospora sp. PR83 TaxID=2884908 RepID=UPI001F3CF865|nr:hypothetical protein [Actinokineospora sp. PR83]MCG8919448.1 hypothetical protein [Actinokineospora sp. PR83]
MGMFRTVLQVGAVGGDVHLHPPRRGATAMVIAVWVPALIAVCSLLPADSVRQAAPAPSPPPSASTAPTAPGTTTATTPVQPVRNRTVVVRTPGDPVTALDGLRIDVDTAGFTSTHDGSVRCGGGGDGPGGGGCGAVAGGSSGASVVGVIDFSVLTPTLSCTVSSVHINESAVVVELDGTWSRIVVAAIGPNDADGALPITFDVSRGRGAPVPTSPKVCVLG